MKEAGVLEENKQDNRRVVLPERSNTTVSKKTNAGQHSLV